MFKIKEDKSIHVTRGDTITFDFTVSTGDGNYLFRPGDVVRIKVFEKKSCHCVEVQKDFRVATETETIDIVLTGEETKIGELISKPKDYWYEIELNPDIQPITLIGYDDDGAKLFRLYPEGGDLL